MTPYTDDPEAGRATGLPLLLMWLLMLSISAAIWLALLSFALFVAGPAGVVLVCAAPVAVLLVTLAAGQNNQTW